MKKKTPKSNDIYNDPDNFWKNFLKYRDTREKVRDLETNQRTIQAARQLSELLNKDFNDNEFNINRNDPRLERKFIGSLRQLLAPADTSAFPYDVLSRNVYSDMLETDSLGAAGVYNPVSKDISLDPREFVHNFSRSKGPSYATLLHEAGHARGLDNELDADALMDSLLKARRLRR